MELQKQATRDRRSASSTSVLARARRSIAGGDSSSMRVPPYHLPLVADRGEGGRVWDVEGREYIDLNMAYGPLLLGHRHPRVIDAVVRQIAERGSQLGFPTELGTRVAEKLKVLFPGVEMMRFANSGTEAAASAARLARVVTGRSVIVMFEGHYHGWSEALFNRYHADLGLLASKGYGPAIPGTHGLTSALDDIVVARWNDLDSLEAVFDAYRGRIAAVLMEPVMGNAGVIPPRPGYLLAVREMTRRRHALLIFDEVITGLRIAAGGAQEHYEVEADVTIVSKALGGGFAVAAFGASSEIMAPIVDGTLFHGGVYSGNATAMAASEAVLDVILESRRTMYPRLYRLSDALSAGIREIMSRLGIPHVVNAVGPMLSLFLTRTPIDGIREYRDVRRHGDFERFIGFQHALQTNGVYLHPNMFEPMYLSTAHTSGDIDVVLQRIAAAARETLI